MPRKPGPTRDTADVIALKGNRSKLSKEEIERRAEEDVKARPLAPTPPKDLSSHARECWQMHAPELEKLGLLSTLDAASFRMACEAYALAVSALEDMRPKKADGTPDLRARSYQITTPDKVHGGAPRKHPAFAVFNMAQNAYRAWCVEFGLTPSARVGLRPGARPAAGGVEGGADDDDAEFFGA